MYLQGNVFRVHQVRSAPCGEDQEVGQEELSLRQLLCCHAHSLCRPDQRRMGRVSFFVNIFMLYLCLYTPSNSHNFYEDKYLLATPSVIVVLKTANSTKVLKLSTPVNVNIY